MEHIRSVGQDPWPKEVPYLLENDASYGSYVYDNGQWSTYPERVGWSTRELMDFNPNQPSQNSEHTSARAASLLQAWLYFGFIHSITEIRVDTQRYVKTTAEGRQIHTAHASSEIERPYLAAGSVFLHPDPVDDVDEFQEAAVPKFCLSQRIAVGDADLKIRDHLLERGHCKATVQRLKQTFNSLTNYYIGSSPLPKTSRNHSNCDTNSCKALQSVDKSYNPRHFSDGCLCSPADLDTERLKTIIALESIPVLYYSDQGQLELHAIDPQEHHHDVYIAISHVWADGLGNPHGNSMNACQLKLMQERVSNISRRMQSSPSFPTVSKAWFWIDTLCVPSLQCPEKTTAIASMEAVYKQAGAVLVIDSDLELIDDIFSPVHIAIMIVSSVWLTRLWTIQEAAFAKEVYFQLRDVAVTENQLRRVISKAGYSLQGVSALRWDSNAMIISNVLSKFRFLRLDQIRSGNGVDFLRNMQWRFTTRAADEAICLAILFGFSKDRIAFLHKLPEDADERMKHFLLIQKYVHKELIFWEPMDRGNFHFDNMSWAPPTFLGRVGGSGSYTYRDPFTQVDIEMPNTQSLPIAAAFIDEQGCHVEFPGIALSLEKHDEKGKPNVDVFVEDICAHYVVWLVRNGDVLNYWDMFSDMKDPMIILPLEASTSRPLVTNPMRIGVLVNATNKSGDEIICSLKARVISFGRAWKVGSISEVAIQARAQIVTGRSIANRKWCIR